MLGFPRGEGEAGDRLLGTASWISRNALEAAVAGGGDLSHPGGNGFWLGRCPYSGKAACVNDDRHVVAIAGSRAGKGRNVIIPNLLQYRGSVVCIDPKGENFNQTAGYRGIGSADMSPLGQTVRVLDPFNVCNASMEYAAYFNPLTLIRPEADDAIEIADLIADSMVVPGDSKDAHWDETARAWIQAVILLVATDGIFSNFANLVTVKLLIDGVVSVIDIRNDCIAQDGGEVPEEERLPPIDELVNYMVAFGQLADPSVSRSHRAIQDVIGAAAQSVRSMGEAERGSVFSTVARNLRFLQSLGMQDSLTGAEGRLRSLSLDDLKTSAKGVSLYLVLPQRHMASHSRWLRMIITLIVARMETIARPPANGLPLLAVLDEFNVLGYMKVIETSAGFMAGFGLKMLVVLQDLAQLKRHYEKSWETFLGNAGTVIAFGNTDLTTLEHLSKRLGHTQVDLASPQNSTTETDTKLQPSLLERARLQREARTAGMSVDGDAGLLSHQHTDSTSQTRTVTPTRAELMTPDEISRFFARDPRKTGVVTPAKGQADAPLMLVAMAGWKPVALLRTNYDRDPEFLGRIAASSGHKGRARDAGAGGPPPGGGRISR